MKTGGECWEKIKIGVVFHYTHIQNVEKKENYFLKKKKLKKESNINPEHNKENKKHRVENFK